MFLLRFVNTDVYHDIYRISTRGVETVVLLTQTK